MTYHINNVQAGTTTTINGGSGGNTFDVNNTLASATTTLNTGTGNDTVNVLATGGNTLNIHGQAGLDTVTLGGSTEAPLGMQGLAGTVNVYNALGSTGLTFDDSQDTTGQTAALSNDGTNGQATGLSPATINYVNAAISGMTVNGGSGGNTFTVSGTLVNAGFNATLTTLNKGTGQFNTVNVLATSVGSTLAIHGQGGIGSTDAVSISSSATVKGLVMVNELHGGLTAPHD